MRIPRFWAAVEGSGTGPHGERLFRRVWGWSMSSVADARAVAHEQLRNALATIRSGVRPGGYYPLGHWPYEEDWAERRFQRWLTDYEAVAREYAVCRLLAVHGPAPSTLEARIIGLHDDRTRASEALPLA